RVNASYRTMLSCKTAWRKASLACKLSIDWLEKDDLLNSEDMWIRHRPPESLMSISRMMAQQVQQSEETMSTLVGATSSRPVLETHEEFKAMTGTIQLGRKLIIIYNGKMACDVLLLTEQTIKATTHLCYFVGVIRYFYSITFFCC
uniref:Sec20 C-terminal domain-containing protein n=1 Tax=Cyprinus carpio TaxID=7962 RepID=A0A8C1LP84_CYPCA